MNVKWYVAVVKNESPQGQSYNDPEQCLFSPPISRNIISNAKLDTDVFEVGNVKAWDSSGKDALGGARE